jgi:hypothetical protein
VDRDIVNITKSKRGVNENNDERRDLKGSKNLCLNENIIAPI